MASSQPHGTDHPALPPPPSPSSSAAFANGHHRPANSSSNGPPRQLPGLFPPDELGLMPSPHYQPPAGSAAGTPTGEPDYHQQQQQQRSLYPPQQAVDRMSSPRLLPLLGLPPASHQQAQYPSAARPGGLSMGPSSSSSYYGSGAVGGTPLGAYHELPPMLASPAGAGYFALPGPGPASSSAASAATLAGGSAAHYAQPQAAGGPSSSSPAHSHASAGKKRRPSGSSTTLPRPAQAEDDADGHDGDDADGGGKRTKTPRACDRCRTKKTRCDLIPGTEPMICKFCVKNSLECTFFLPITETRWKKKKPDGTPAGGGAGPAPMQGVKAEGQPPAPSLSAPHPPAPQQQQEARPRPTAQLPYMQPPPPANYYNHFATPTAKHLAPNAAQPLGPPHTIFQHAAKPPASPQPRQIKPSPAASHYSGSASGSTGYPSSSAADRTHDRLARIHGPTSIPFLIHSSAAIPPSIWERYDLKHHTTWEISAGGDGVVKVLAPPGPPPGDGGPEEEISAGMLEKLVNLYFEEISPMFPVVTRHEFLSLENPSPLLLYSICALASTRRAIPRSVFSSLRTIINGIIRQNDVLSDTSLVNVQSLLICSLVGDLHSSVGAGGAVGTTSVRLGVAIRMAQDLGLHRDEIKSTVEMSEHDRLEERAFLELKRRVWAGCVIMDRWYSASLGTPMLIDLLDCDVLLPDPCEVPLPARLNDPSCQGQPYAFASEFLKLSILLGRVTKTIYGPTGLLHANDHQLNSLLQDLKAWKASLPPALQFVGASTSMSAGMLHLLYGSIVFLFWRVHMRISYQCPPHLQFSMSAAQWSEVVALSHEAIRWIDIGNNDQVLDTFFIPSYATASLALVQYHTWARRKDSQAIESLRILKDVVKRWEAVVQPTPGAVHPMAVRHKTLEIMGLLYTAAKHTSPHPTGASPTAYQTHATSPSAFDGTGAETETEERTLNPTTGVVSRGEWIGQRVTFWKDPTMPGGGVFAAEDAVRKKVAQDGQDVSEPQAQEDGGGALAMTGIESGADGAPASAGSAAGPSTSSRASFGRENVFNVNPHIQDIGLSNMGAAQIDDSVVDPTFGGLFAHDIFPPATPGPGAGADGGGGSGTVPMGPVEMLEGLPTSVFDWDRWSAWSKNWAGLDESPDSELNFQVPPGGGGGGGGESSNGGNGLSSQHSNGY